MSARTLERPTLLHVLLAKAQLLILWERQEGKIPSLHFLRTPPASFYWWESLWKIYWQELKKESASTSPFLPPLPTRGWFFFGGHTSQWGVLVCSSQGYDLGEPENRSGEYKRGCYIHNSHKPSVETLQIYSMCWAEGESGEKSRRALTEALSYFYFYWRTVWPIPNSRNTRRKSSKSMKSIKSANTK